MKTYKTFDELLKKKIHKAFEDSDNYYIKLDLDPGVNYDVSLWVVNKKTGEVTYMDIMDFLYGDDGLSEKAKEIDLSAIKRAS